MNGDDDRVNGSTVSETDRKDCEMRFDGVRQRGRSTQPEWQRLAALGARVAGTSMATSEAREQSVTSHRDCSSQCTQRHLQLLGGLLCVAVAQGQTQLQSLARPHMTGHTLKSHVGS